MSDKMPYDLVQESVHAHQERYTACSRLLTTFSAAYITLLISSPVLPTPLVKVSLGLQLVSLFAGLVIQHQVTMQTPGHQGVAESIQAEDERKSLSSVQINCHRAQLTSLVLSLTFASAHFLLL